MFDLLCFCVLLSFLGIINAFNGRNVGTAESGSHLQLTVDAAKVIDVSNATLNLGL